VQLSGSGSNTHINFLHIGIVFNYNLLAAKDRLTVSYEVQQCYMLLSKQSAFIISIYLKEIVYKKLLGKKYIAHDFADKSLPIRES